MKQIFNAATWCGPCKMISPIFEQLSGKYGSKMSFLKASKFCKLVRTGSLEICNRWKHNLCFNIHNNSTCNIELICRAWHCVRHLSPILFKFWVPTTCFHCRWMWMRIRYAVLVYVSLDTAFYLFPPLKLFTWAGCYHSALGSLRKILWRELIVCSDCNVISPEW